MQSLNYPQEIAYLYQTEFGSPFEVLIRLGGTIIGAGAVWTYTGWWFAWVWVGVYLILDGLYFIYLRSRLKTLDLQDFVSAQVLFLLTLSSFVWLPAILIASGDEALSFSGMSIMAGVIVFLVRRCETSLMFALCCMGVVSLALCAGAAPIIMRQTDPVAAFGVFFATGTLIFYLCQNAFILRQQRLRANAIAARTIQGQKMEAIGRLSGGVAHDFNNILTTVLGNIELSQETHDPDQKRELLENARQSARHGARVVKQLLLYARRSEISPNLVPVDQTLASVRNMARSMMVPSVVIKVAQYDAHSLVRVDQSLLIAALLNLIKNAADAMMGRGTVTLTAKRKHFKEPSAPLGGVSILLGQYIAFCVSDTGTGIPGTILNEVFEPFFTTKPIGEGSGLGLSMVLDFSQKSGGGLTLHTSPEGTTIEICIPEVVPPLIDIPAPDGP